MSNSAPTYRRALMDLVQKFPEESLPSLLDYAEYLLQRQARQDAEDIADSELALAEEGFIAWEEVKQEIRARVHD
jgi:hypothetical protein